MSNIRVIEKRVNVGREGGGGGGEGSDHIIQYLCDGLNLSSCNTVEELEELGLQVGKKLLTIYLGS